MRLPLRQTVFWTHLVCGVTLSGIVLLLSVTGVILTYEKQMAEWADREFWQEPTGSPSSRAPVSDLLDAAEAHDPESPVTALTFLADEDAPVLAQRGRSGTVYLDPSTAEVRGVPNTGLRDFFGAVRSWHRWFAVEGEGRASARAAVGWANLGFFFLILTGLYLWFPRRWAARHFRAVLLFKPRARGKARDFNWHHVVGFWTALPLAVVVFTGVTISFPAVREVATALLVSEATAPEVDRIDGQPEEVDGPEAVAESMDPAVLDEIAVLALGRMDDWKRVTLAVPGDGDTTIQAQIYQGLPGQPQKRYTALWDARTGAEVGFEAPGAQPAASRLRGFFRFAHTGEYYGIVGQTVAGLVSLLSVVLIWTGLALTWRRMLRAVRRRWREEERATADGAAEGLDVPSPEPRSTQRPRESVGA